MSFHGITRRVVSAWVIWGCAVAGVAAQNPDSLRRSQEQHEALAVAIQGFNDAPRGNRGARLMFYNVENAFWPEDDSLTIDEEFTPEGANHWTFARYYDKLRKIYQVIAATGGWELPAIVGFCEIETRRVLDDLIKHTPLRRAGYRVVHQESPDARGIDVGLIYRASKFRLLESDWLFVPLPDNPQARTRDVLYAKGLLLGVRTDTLHIFVNHWPSRRGGVAASEPRRMSAARVVRAKVDAILRQDPHADIVIMGDLNDEWNNRSLTEGLRARSERSEMRPGDLYAYMGQIARTSKLGSEKYREHWGIIDHVIVSEGLLEHGQLRAASEGAKIFTAKFLLTDDERFFGLMPFRTYAGPKYLGGFSDHLPVYIDIMRQ